MNAKIFRLNELVMSNLQSDLSLARQAEWAGLSVSYLCALIKKEIGLPPARYIKGLRMEKAKQLLENTTLSIKEITARVGIKNTSHFVREFKRSYGLTPSGYRNQFILENPMNAATKEIAIAATSHQAT